MSVQMFVSQNIVKFRASAHTTGVRTFSDPSLITSFVHSWAIFWAWSSPYVLSILWVSLFIDRIVLHCLSKSPSPSQVTSHHLYFSHVIHALLYHSKAVVKVVANHFISVW